MLVSGSVASDLATGQVLIGPGYCQFVASGFAIVSWCVELYCGLYWIWWLVPGSMWTEYVLGRVWSLGQVSVRALGGGVITSGLVIGRLEMGQVFLLFGAYAFVMTLYFGNTALWPLVFSASGRRQHACWVYSWVCSSNQEESYL